MRNVAVLLWCRHADHEARTPWQGVGLWSGCGEARSAVSQGRSGGGGPMQTSQDRRGLVVVLAGTLGAQQAARSGVA